MDPNVAPLAGCGKADNY